MFKSTFILIFTLVNYSSFAFTSETAIFDEYQYGKSPQYYIQDEEARQDVSGAAWTGDRLLLAYDGGENSVDVGVRLFPALNKGEKFKSAWKKGNLLSRSVMQRDIEGATFANGSFYTVASLSVVDLESSGYRLLAEFTVNDDSQKITWERSVDFREKFIQSLNETCPYPNWFSRIANVFAKRGGLNVEGLSFDPTNADALIMGLRSPLCSPLFGSPSFGKKLSLRTGMAMMVNVDRPFSSKPKFSYTKLDLKGHGIRGIEYIKHLKGFVIIGGPVEKANDFSLWLYRDDKTLIPLALAGFEKLCRPESVSPINIEGKQGLIVLSEEAGLACKDAPYTYIAATFIDE